MKLNQPTQPIDLNQTALKLPAAWKSVVVGNVGQTRIKVLRMDDLPFAAEAHDFNEGLLVIDGQLLLQFSDHAVTVGAGQLYVVKAGISHSVMPGSSGTLLIIDLESQAA